MEKLSTLMNNRKGLKVSYQRSYPHYPHFLGLFWMVYIEKMKTDVLYKSDKTLPEREKPKNPLDFFKVELLY